MATKTFEELKQLAIQIRDEKTNKQNTATRIGTQMLEHLDKLEQDYYDKTATDEKFTEIEKKLIFSQEAIRISDYTIDNYVWNVSNGEFVYNDIFKCTQKIKINSDLLLSFNNSVYRLILWKNDGFDYLSDINTISVDSKIYKYISFNFKKTDDVTCVIHNNIEYYNQSHKKDYDSYSDEVESDCVESGYIDYNGNVKANVNGVNRGVTDFIDINDFDAVLLIENGVHINTEHNIFGALYNSDKQFIKALAYNFKGQYYDDVNTNGIIIDCKYAYFMRLTVNDYSNKIAYKPLKTTDYNPIYKNIELKDISNNLVNTLSVGEYGYNIDQ